MPFASFLLLILIVSLAWGAAAQSPAPDIRALSLRSLRAGRSVRVAGHDIGTVTGMLVGVHDGSLWLNADPARGPVPLAGIDSVWVSHGHGGTGALLGLVVGTVVARAALAHKECGFSDNSCITTAALSAIGITGAGALVGSAIGSGLKSWDRRYP